MEKRGVICEHGQAVAGYAIILCFISITAVLVLTEIGKMAFSFFAGVIFP